jgi:hypothetical protein
MTETEWVQSSYIGRRVRSFTAATRPRQTPQDIGVILIGTTLRSFSVNSPDGLVS